MSEFITAYRRVKDELRDKRRPWIVEGGPHGLVYAMDGGDPCGHHHLDIGMSCRRPRGHKDAHACYSYDADQGYRVEWNDDGTPRS